MRRPSPWSLVACLGFTSPLTRIFTSLYILSARGSFSTAIVAVTDDGTDALFFSGPQPRW